jgi:DNA-binding transcriptional regulator YiaG
MATTLASLPAEEQLHSVVKKIHERFPEATVSVDAPEDVHGTWYVDINLKGHAIAVQWMLDRGFGITSKTEIAYGEGADEVYQNADDAYRRLVTLLLGRSGTLPPLATRFRELREALGISQSELAKSVGRRQASISKFEHRNDILLGTLSDFVEGLGGKLKIVVSIDGHDINLGTEENIAIALRSANQDAITQKHGG